LPNDFVNDFAFDDHGNVWMATQDGGVAEFDGAKSWTVYNTSNSALPYHCVMGVSIDANGNLWIGTGKAHDGGRSSVGVAVYREGGVIPHGLGLGALSLFPGHTGCGSCELRSNSCSTC
jgi:hypothetical protein